MPIESVTAGSQPSAIQSALGGADVSKQQFLNLLVNQLKAQDPFEPVKNEAFLAQLATFSQLEEQQQTTGVLRNLLMLQEATLALGGLSQGASLVGKTVEYIDPDTGNQVRGTVQSVFFDPSGVLVEVDGHVVPAGNIVIISTGAAAAPPPPAPAPSGTPVQAAAVTAA